jgi:CubicO group peptidase (beta-lactamase class C family)
MFKPSLISFAFAGLLLGSPPSLPAQSLDSVRAEMRRLGDAGEFSGVVLLRKGGKTMLHEAYGLASIEYKAPNKVDTRFNLASVGKMFTAVAIGQLVEQGKLKWTDTLAKVLPDYPNKAQAGRITIHQLLTHTSGMGLYWENLFKGNWTAVRTAQDLVPFFVNDSLLAPPGTAWNYSNTGYAVLALVIEKVSGEDYFAYLQKHIFDPLGMKGTDYSALDEDIPNKATGYFREGPNAPLKNNLFTHTVKGGGAGGGWSTSSDLATFAEAYMAGKLFSKSTLASMTKAHATLPPPPGGGGGGSSSYGYGTFVNARDGKPVWGHTGGFPGIMTILNMYPATGDVMVMQSNNPNPTARKVWQALEKLM